jgi:hypothetical protein
MNDKDIPELLHMTIVVLLLIFICTFAIVGVKNGWL